MLVRLKYVLVALLLPQLLLAQRAQRFEVPDAPACATCTIRLESSTTLTATALDGEISTLPFTVRADPTGRFWVVSEESLPRVYSATGDYRYTFGRSGQGPGEIIQVEDLFWPTHDTVVVIDGRMRRTLVFAAESTYVRQARLSTQLVNPRVLSWPGAVAMSGSSPGARVSGMTIHLASFAGEDVRITQSFSSGDGSTRPGVRPEGFHTLDLAPSGLIVSVGPSPFVVQRWTRDGAEHSRIARRAGWFPDSGAARIGRPNAPPTPAVTAMYVDGDGLIWVFIRQAAASWREGWAGVPADAREVSRSQLDYGRLFDTRVEVIDAVRRRVIATTRITGLAFATPGDGSVAVYRSDASGEPSVSVERYRLERR